MQGGNIPDEGTLAVVGLGPGADDLLTPRARAVLRAMTEAAQSRMTFISGARDDAYRQTFEQVLPEETRQAFDLYGRSVSARRSGVPGVGVGLAIVRQLTDAMGGDLRVVTAPGEGSSFWLQLGAAAPGPDKAA